jgi:TonB family protein
MIVMPTLFVHGPVWSGGPSACGALAWSLVLALLLPRAERLQSRDATAWPQYREVERPIALPEPSRPKLISAVLPELAESVAQVELAPLGDGSRRLAQALAQTWTHLPAAPPASAPTAKPTAPPPARPAAGFDESTRAPVDVQATLVSGPPPTYPSRSRRAGEEGSVKLRIRVEADGKVGDVWIVEGSGFERLDQAASQAVRAWTFKPATRDGVAMPSLVMHTVTFKLDRPRD